MAAGSARYRPPAKRESETRQTGGLSTSGLVPAPSVAAGRIATLDVAFRETTTSTSNGWPAPARPSSSSASRPTRSWPPSACASSRHRRAAAWHTGLPGLTRGEGVLESAFERYRPVAGAAPTRPRSDHNPLNRKEYLLHVVRRV
jgi:hypothetical protein